VRIFSSSFQLELIDACVHYIEALQRQLAANLCEEKENNQVAGGGGVVARGRTSSRSASDDQQLLQQLQEQSELPSLRQRRRSFKER